MQKISPFLWFDTQAEEAMNFYLKVFGEDPSSGNVVKGQDGSVMSVTFKLKDQEFMGLNAGPDFKFNESISFFINCADQEEVDKYWNVLISEGGEEGNCGWVKDKFGLSWQVIPEALGRLMSDSDGEKAGKVVQAMLNMKKIIVSELEAAYNS